MMLGALMTQSGAHDHVAHAHVLHDVFEAVMAGDEPVLVLTSGAHRVDTAYLATHTPNRISQHERRRSSII